MSISEQCCFLSPCREEFCFQDSFIDFSANESIFPTTVCSNKIFCLMLVHRRIGSAFLLMNFSIRKGSSLDLLGHLLKTVLTQRKDKVEVWERSELSSLILLSSSGNATEEEMRLPAIDLEISRYTKNYRKASIELFNNVFLKDGFFKIDIFVHWESEGILFIIIFFRILSDQLRISDDGIHLVTFWFMKRGKNFGNKTAVIVLSHEIYHGYQVFLDELVTCVKWQKFRFFLDSLLLLLIVLSKFSWHLLTSRLMVRTDIIG